jgi:hypothetical protein
MAVHIANCFASGRINLAAIHCVVPKSFASFLTLVPCDRSPASFRYQRSETNAGRVVLDAFQIVVPVPFRP